MTAVEWLIQQLVELDKQLDGRRKNDDATVIKLNPTKIYEQAKQMEKEQLENARPQIISNCVIKEISDEEIENAALKEYNNNNYQYKYWEIDAFVCGAKWYREQLKSK